MFLLLFQLFPLSACPPVQPAACEDQTDSTSKETIQVQLVVVAFVVGDSVVIGDDVVVVVADLLLLLLWTLLLLLLFFVKLAVKAPHPDHYAVVDSVVVYNLYFILNYISFDYAII